MSEPMHEPTPDLPSLPFHQTNFTETYQHETSIPWDIGKPQPSIVAIADTITGSVIDLGCGTGEHALFFAQRGQPATGIDFVPVAIERAKAKAAQRGSDASFLVQDVLKLDSFDQHFDNGIDSGLFHVFGPEDRRMYATGLAHIIKPGGRLFLLCFSDREPAGGGPHRISQADIKAAFEGNWTLESIEETHFTIVPDFEASFSPGGPLAWLCVLRRNP